MAAAEEGSLLIALRGWLAMVEELAFFIGLFSSNTAGSSSSSKNLIWVEEVGVSISEDPPGMTGNSGNTGWSFSRREVRREGGKGDSYGCGWSDFSE